MVRTNELFRGARQKGRKNLSPREFFMGTADGEIFFRLLSSQKSVTKTLTIFKEVAGGGGGGIS